MPTHACNMGVSTTGPPREAYLPPFSHGRHAPSWRSECGCALAARWSLVPPRSLGATASTSGGLACPLSLQSRRNATQRRALLPCRGPSVWCARRRGRAGRCELLVDEDLIVKVVVRELSREARVHYSEAVLAVRHVPQGQHGLRGRDGGAHRRTRQRSAGLEPRLPPGGASL